MVRKVGKYELGKTIGEGAYSKHVLEHRCSIDVISLQRCFEAVYPRSSSSYCVAPMIATYIRSLLPRFAVLAAKRKILMHARCRVKYAIDLETGRRVAIKIMDQSVLKEQKMMEAVRREVRTFSVLRLADIHLWSALFFFFFLVSFLSGVGLLMCILRFKL